MIANYHTHTTRCGHAIGTDRKYVESAIIAGYKILGFSDHVPVPFDGGYRSPIRMGTDEIAGYFNSLTQLKAEYKKDIHILIGFEMEYYPDYFEKTLSLLSDYPADYLILGQHYLDNEIGSHRTTHPTDREDYLEKYVDQCIQGLDTGVFTYFAHPDTLNFTGDKAFYEAQMRRLCEHALKANVPLELNLTGLRTPYIYPHEPFFRIATEVGNPVILGFDAHEPDALTRTDVVRAATRLAKKHGLTVLDRAELVNPFTARTERT